MDGTKFFEMFAIVSQIIGNVVNPGFFLSYQEGTFI